MKCPPDLQTKKEKKASISKLDQYFSHNRVGDAVHRMNDQGEACERLMEVQLAMNCRKKWKMSWETGGRSEVIRATSAMTKTGL